ncbi:MAG: hypothetical protein GF418_12715 [Chitinivibrionales bacterium]|nr:hypothetical protein [Chitinivibrionales bacterium]MBD3396482.1 hypothetical protein [Chitinivibrionales bacterium]
MSAFTQRYLVLALVFAHGLVPDAGARSSSAYDKMTRRRHDRMLEMYYEYKVEAFADVADITVETLLEGPAEMGYVLLDAREKEEREVSMIPGAISRHEFESNRRRYKDSTVVVYCTIGYRSGVYAKKLKRKGFRVYNLVGGVLAWAHAGREFVNDSISTRRVHVYGKKWDLAPMDYEATW